MSAREVAIVLTDEQVARVAALLSLAQASTSPDEEARHEH